jgi:hypothetical protein
MQELSEETDETEEMDYPFRRLDSKYKKLWLHVVALQKAPVATTKKEAEPIYDWYTSIDYKLKGYRWEEPEDSAAVSGEEQEFPVVQQRLPGGPVEEMLREFQYNQALNTNPWTGSLTEKDRYLNLNRHLIQFPVAPLVVVRTDTDIHECKIFDRLSSDISRITFTNEEVDALVKSVGVVSDDNMNYLAEHETAMVVEAMEYAKQFNNALIFDSEMNPVGDTAALCISVQIGLTSPTPRAAEAAASKEKTSELSAYELSSWGKDQMQEMSTADLAAMQPSQWKAFKIEQLAMLNPKQINQLVYSTFAHHDAVKMAFRKLLEHANIKYNVWNDRIESSLDALKNGTIKTLYEKYITTKKPYDNLAFALAAFAERKVLKKLSQMEIKEVS